MVNTYRLVNPHIEGNFNSKIKANNSKEAGNIFYKNLSEHFNNSVPKFHFTIQKGSSGDGKYYHFEVKELRSKNEVSYNVLPMKLSSDVESMESFKSRLDNFKAKFNQDQDGGKKHKKSHKIDSDKSDKSDDSDSSDWDASSDEFYRRAKSYQPVNQPIYYWWYDPYLYNLNSIYIPTFYSYVTPYIELNLKL